MHVGVMDGSSSQAESIEWRTTSSYIAIRTPTLMKYFYLLKSCQILTKLLEKIDPLVVAVYLLGLRTYNCLK